MAETITIHALFSKAHLRDISIDKLHSSVYQPREHFSEEGIASLAKTIEQLGVLEPIIIRQSMQKRGQYEIVAGERRFRAAKLAGLTEVPCLLSNYTNEQAAQIALIENTCREALNPIAEAQAMQRLAKRQTSQARKSSSIASPIEKQLTDQLGFPMKVTINKNEAGSFRIPFHSREQMHTILEKLGCHSIEVEPQE